MAEVNITPLVDVTFFILVIFIMIAPLIEYGINVNLPAAAPKKLDQPEGVVVSIRRTGEGARIYLDEERVTLGDLSERLRTVAARAPETPLVFRADRDLRYETVVEVLDRIAEAGLTRLGIATVAAREE